MRVGGALPFELKEPSFEGAGGWSPGKLEDGAADQKSAVLIAGRAGGYELRWKPETHSGASPQDVKAGGSRRLVLGLAGR